MSLISPYPGNKQTALSEGTMTKQYGLPVSESVSCRLPFRAKRQMPQQTLRRRFMNTSSAIGNSDPVSPTNTNGQRQIDHPLGRACYSVLGLSDPVQRQLGGLGPKLLRADTFTPLEVDQYTLPVDTVGCQCEIAFELARDYPLKGECVNLASALSAIATTFPVFVVMKGRKRTHRSPAKINSVEMISEGTRVFFDTFDAVDQRSVLHRNGKIAWDVTSVLVRPVDGFMWAAERLNSLGSSFKKGDIVTVGSAPIMLEVEPGDRLFAAIGEAKIICGFSG